MNVYRYEWLFFDEEQDTGLFQGLHDVGLTKVRIFDKELPLPPREIFNNKKTKSFLLHSD